MARLTPCCSVGFVVLLVAFVLQVIVTISLPFIPALNVVSIKFPGSSANDLPTVTDVSGEIRQLKLGIWAYCGEAESSGDNSCIHTGYAYSVAVLSSRNDQVAKIHSSWTRGLVVHPIAAVATFFALVFALSHHIAVLLIASLLSLLAALLTLIAFAIDIALFVLSKNSVDNLSDINPDTDFGLAFWLTLVSFVLLLVASVTTCVHRRIRKRSVEVKEGQAVAVSRNADMKEEVIAADSTTVTPVAPTSATGEKKPIWKRWRKGGRA